MSGKQVRNVCIFDNVTFIFRIIKGTQVFFMEQIIIPKLEMHQKCKFNIKQVILKCLKNYNRKFFKLSHTFLINNHPLFLYIPEYFEQMRKNVYHYYRTFLVPFRFHTLFFRTYICTKQRKQSQHSLIHTHTLSSYLVSLSRTF